MGPRWGEVGRGVAGALRSVVDALAFAFAMPPPVRPWPLRTRGRRNGRPRDLVWLFDVALAVVVTAGTAAAFQERNDALGRPVGPLVILVAAFGIGGAQVARDRWPMAAWRLSLAVVAVSATALGPLYEQVPLFPTHVLVLLATSYTAVVRAERPVALGVWLVSMVGVALLPVPAASGSAVLPPEGWVAAVLMMTAPVVLGHNVRARRETQQALVDEQHRGEIDRAERAVLAERARIARELHDVVAHHMTLIAIQAEAAPLRHPADASALAAEMASIRSMSLTALAETRRILGVLRDDEAPTDRAPAPGLATLPELVATARVAGHPVTLRCEVADDEVTPGLALSVHRIVQESLSNALRHAPEAVVNVTIMSLDDGHLAVEVVNGPAARPAPPAASSGGGQGLVGMRERVTMLDGRLEVGATDDGGYAVRAVLPNGRT